MQFYAWIAGILLGLLASGLSFNNMPTNGPRKYGLSVNYWKQSNGVTSNQVIPVAVEKRPRSYGLSVNYWKQSSGGSKQTSSIIASVATANDNDGSACAAETYITKLSNTGGKPTRSYGLSSNNWKKSNDATQQTTSTSAVTTAVTSSTEKLARSYGLSSNYWKISNGESKQIIPSSETTTTVSSSTKKTERSYGLSSNYWKTSNSASKQTTSNSAASTGSQNKAQTSQSFSSAILTEKPTRSYGLSTNYWKKSNSQQISSSPSSPTASSIDNNPKPKSFLSDQNKELLFSLLNVAAIGYVVGILVEIAMNILKAKRSGLIPI